MDLCDHCDHELPDYNTVPWHVNETKARSHGNRIKSELVWPTFRDSCSCCMVNLN
jgi:hypothetical protein